MAENFALDMAYAGISTVLYMLPEGEGVTLNELVEETRVCLDEMLADPENSLAGFAIEEVTRLAIAKGLREGEIREKNTAGTTYYHPTKKLTNFHKKLDEAYRKNH